MNHLRFIFITQFYSYNAVITFYIYNYIFIRRYGVLWIGAVLSIATFSLIGRHSAFLARQLVFCLAFWPSPMTVSHGSLLSIGDWWIEFTTETFSGQRVPVPVAVAEQSHSTSTTTQQRTKRKQKQTKIIAIYERAKTKMSTHSEKLLTVSRSVPINIAIAFRAYILGNTAEKSASQRNIPLMEKAFVANIFMTKLN